MENLRASYAIYVCDVQQGLKSHPNDRVKAVETENIRGCQALTVQKIDKFERRDQVPLAKEYTQQQSRTDIVSKGSADRFLWSSEVLEVAIIFNI